MLSKPCYILRGIDCLGEVAYYTGKAGHAFVDHCELFAFPYETLAGARRKAEVLNRMDMGWKFMPMGFVPNHGAVPASALDQYIPFPIGTHSVLGYDGEILFP